jgi:hypothetical protein
MEDVSNLEVPVPIWVASGSSEPFAEAVPPVALEGGVELGLSSELGADGGSGSLVNAKGDASSSGSSCDANP